ncbi:MAG: D-cysteine desulfhydrase family protein [Candidatus Aminicenantes bacterium]|nr:D-cysteine desulfhydrase family protein [Candidatus Aminicenantes bacterium]
MTGYSISELREKIQKYPKKDLIQRPTPFYKLENLSQVLGGPQIYIKRDDLTGLAFGGNKSRKLEYIMQDILDKGADVVVTWAALQSNWCLQTAAAAKKYGIKPILVLFKTSNLPEESDGNLLLDSLLGADIRIRSAEKGQIIREEEAEELLADVIREVKQKGLKPYFAPIGGSMVGGSMDVPLGAIGYVDAYVEMVEQASNLDVDVDYVLHASGSGGTQAGLTVGAVAMGNKVRVIGISVSEDKKSYSERVWKISGDTSESLHLDIQVKLNDVIVHDEYIKEGYGIINKDVSEAIRITAENEGIFLDPVYTGKAMAAFIDLISKGHFKKNDNVVFFHTGGTAALFPNKHHLMRLALKASPKPR